MRPRPAWLATARPLAVASLAFVLGCQDRAEPDGHGSGDATGAGPTDTALDDTASPATEAAPRPAEADPFAGIEALRPQPWTGWPLENVDIEIEAGWRIDPVTGGYALERGLVLAADPGAFVLAIAPGEVVELRQDPGSETGPSEHVTLVIAHGDGVESRYGPLSDALAHVGMPVTRGAAVGLAAGPTLRLQVSVDGVAIDPLLALRQPLHRWPALTRERPAPPSPGP